MKTNTRIGYFLNRMLQWERDMVSSWKGKGGPRQLSLDFSFVLEVGEQ